MSGYSILLFVGATTVVAALVTLCAFQMNVAKVQRRISRGSRTLEGPVSGHRSLSSIGLNADAARNSRLHSESQGLQSASVAGLRNTCPQELKTPASSTPSTPLPVGEAKLSSLQTIQARSAALQGDGQQTEPATLSDTAPVDLQSKRNASDQEHKQGLSARRSKNGADKVRSIDGVPLSSALGDEPSAKTRDPKTPASKRAKRPNVQPGRIQSRPSRSDQAWSDVQSDALESAKVLESSGIGGSVSPDAGLPDMFAGLNEAEAGMLWLKDDLSDIDGGGLPSAGKGVIQKSSH